jgi:hypothetical protein
VVLQFELRALHLWGRGSTTWVTPPDLIVFLQLPWVTYAVRNHTAPGCGAAKAGGLRVQGQPGLHRETLSQNNNKQTNKPTAHSFVISCLGPLVSASRISPFGLDGVVVVDPELVKGKKGEQSPWSWGSKGLVSWLTEGRRHLMGRQGNKTQQWFWATLLQCPWDLWCV